jgi:hypothetical protein
MLFECEERTLLVEKVVITCKQSSQRYSRPALYPFCHSPLLSFRRRSDQILVKMLAYCQCRFIGFETPAPQPKELFICHCTECRHQSSSAFGISAIFSRASFESSVMPSMKMRIESGDIKVYERPTATNRTMQCFFCGRCGSRLVHLGKGEEKKEDATVR